jgi:DNA-binding transcriptional MocR family regulator
MDEGVTYSPGSLYYIDPAEGVDFMRLNFTMQSPEAIEEGMRRLGKAINKLTMEPPQPELQVD